MFCLHFLYYFLCFFHTYFLFFYQFSVYSSGFCHKSSVNRGITQGLRLKIAESMFVAAQLLIESAEYIIITNLTSPRKSKTSDITAYIPLIDFLWVLSDTKFIKTSYNNINVIEG